jgi:hypothetical protein
MMTIELTQGKVALVDDEDWELLNPVKWYAQRIGRTFYAARWKSNPDGGGAVERMHRVVLARKLGRAISTGMDTDHDDGDGLNNQRSNLSEKTHRGNLENIHVVKSSQYVGVCWEESRGKWLAHIRVNGKLLNLGRYVTEIEAAFARERYISAHAELGAGSNFRGSVQRA